MLFSQPFSTRLHKKTKSYQKVFVTMFLISPSLELF